MADGNWQPVIGDLLEKLLGLEEEAAILKVKSDNALAKKRKVDTEIKGIKAQLKDMMEEAGVRSDDHPKATLSLSKGRESIKYDDSFDIVTLPVDYVKIERAPDTTQIKAALARGESIPGVQLVRSPDFIRIKFKETSNG